MSRKPISAPGAPLPPPRIMAFHSHDTVHARLNGYDVNMRDIGGIEVGQGQSPHMNDIYLATDISLGFVRIPREHRSYEWSMSGVLIVLDLFNATVIPGTYYRSVMQEGEVKTKSQEAEHDGLTQETNLEGGASARAAWWAHLPIPSFNLGGSAKAKRKRKHTENTALETTVKPLIALVKQEGNRRLRAGSENGNPLNIDTRDLRGAIVSPYLPTKRGAKDSLDEVPTPLVRLKAKDPSKPVLGHITIRAGREDFVLDASKQHEAISLALAEALTKDKQAMLKRRSRAEQDLRHHVAALAATKPNARGYDRPGGGQYDLFSSAFCVEPLTHRAADEES